MKNLILFIKNINNYGFLVFLKVIFYEILYTLKDLDFKSLKYIEFQKDSYDLTKNNKFYNTPYIPTPYFFLQIIKDFFKKKKIRNVVFVDIGCGYSRCERFFKTFFTYFLGFDYNEKIINDLKKNKIKNTKFYHTDLREQKGIDLFISEIVKIKKKRKIVLFFSDSFDLYLLKKIIFKLKKKMSFYCIFINLKNKNFLNKKESYIFCKIFNNIKRNIYIAKF